MLRYGDSDAFSSIIIFRYTLKGPTMVFILYYYLQRLEKVVVKILETLNASVTRAHGNVDDRGEYHSSMPFV